VHGGSLRLGRLLRTFKRLRRGEHADATRADVKICPHVLAQSTEGLAFCTLHDTGHATQRWGGQHDLDGRGPEWPTRNFDTTIK